MDRLLATPVVAVDDDGRAGGTNLVMGTMVRFQSDVNRYHRFLSIGTDKTLA